MDAGVRRDINTGIGRSHGGFELALTPLLFGLLGYWIDQKVGTMPLFTIGLVVIAFGGVVAKTIYVYRYQFQRETALRDEYRAETNVAEAAAEQAANEANQTGLTW